VPLIDTHTHLDFDPFDADRGEVLARCASAGVERVLVLACASSELGQGLADGAG